MNLVKTMNKRQLWEKIQEDEPEFAELLKAANEEFGKITLEEYGNENTNPTQEY